MSTEPYVNKTVRKTWRQQAAQPAPAKCFTCDGENGLPATEAVYICKACKGDEWPAEEWPPAQPAPEELEVQCREVMTRVNERWADLGDKPTKGYIDYAVEFFAAFIRQREAAKDKRIEELFDLCNRACNEADRRDTALAAAAQAERMPLRRALEAEPWLYAIAEPNGHWHDGESCVFADRESAQDEVDSLNDNVEESPEPLYQVVPLYRRAALAPPAQEEKK